VTQLLGAVGALFLLAAPATAQVSALGPPVTVDGPTADIQALTGLAVARDGTGGLIYLKDVAGTPHVFVSRLASGTFQPPEQVDAGLTTASSQPVIAAGGSGQLVVAFINAGQLEVSTTANATTPFSAPTVLFSGASNPSLAMNSLDNKAYLAFTAAGAGGHDIRCAYFNAGRWAVEATPLDANAADDAGTGSDRPDAAAASDGVGIVTWGENGHVYARRVWGIVPSTEFEQADVPAVSGWIEVGATAPSVAVGGDSSYAQVSFQETVASGGVQQTRVLMGRLHGTLFEDPTALDGLDTPGSEGANEPGVSMAEYGNGIATAARSQTNAVYATLLGKNGTAATAARLDSLANFSAPYIAPIAAGYYSDLVAWQHDPGALGLAEIRARYYDGSNFGPEMVLSSPALGATDAAAGLFAASDIQADVAVAWVQGSGANTTIVTDQLYHGIGGFKPEAKFQYARTLTPVLTWTSPRARWGPTYTVTVDGAAVAQTASTSVRAPTLAEGAHSWAVTAVNGGGLQSSTSPATVFVDTVPPTVSFTLGGKDQIGRVVRLHARYTDVPAGGSAAQASGVASVVVRWGDGTGAQTIGHNTHHTYLTARRYTIRVTATDNAGNAATVKQTLQIRKPPPPPKKKKHKHGGKGSGNSGSGGSGSGGSGAGGAHP
jgi:hypothetical protein